ncbi:MAG: FxLYD domain-containing protein [Acidimicrobiales bacterium]
MNANVTRKLLILLTALAVGAGACSGSDADAADRDDTTAQAAESTTSTVATIALPSNSADATGDADSSAADTGDGSAEGESGQQPSDEPADVQPRAGDGSSDPDVGGCRLVASESWPLVAFELTNTGDETVSYFIDFALTDEAGTVVEDTFATVSLVEPGEFVAMHTVVTTNELDLSLDCEVLSVDRTIEHADPLMLADAGGCEVEAGATWGEIAYRINNGSPEPTGYWLTFGLYDSSGVRVAEDFATLSQLEPGGSVAMTTALAADVSDQTDCRVLEVEYIDDQSDPAAMDDIESCEVGVDFANDAEPIVTLTNGDQQTWDYFVDIGLYDSSGVRIAESFASADDVAAAETTTVTGITFVEFELVDRCRVLSVTRTEP